MRRPKLSFLEQLYFPAILSGMALTFRHWLRTLKLIILPEKKSKRTLMDLSATGKATMEYPEETWPLPKGYRGAPALVKDEEGRIKCVSCQLCEFVCPPRAIRITPAEIPDNDPHAHVEKRPKEFEIDMLRCIYCGLCEEVCPEEAIFLKRHVSALTACQRKELLHHKDKLLEIGGTVPLPIHKWRDK